MSDSNQETNLVAKPESSPESEEGRPLLTYIAVGVLVITIVVLVFYAYTKFTDNECEDEEEKPDKEDLIADFNLRDAIQSLQATQNRVLSSISDISNI
jgi:hypothetical protein